MAQQGFQDRIAQQAKVVEGGNPTIYLYNCSEIRRLIPLLELSDLSQDEAIAIHYALANAYGRKLAGHPLPRNLHAVPEVRDRAEKVGPVAG